jgi:hypothetical protein
MVGIHVVRHGLNGCVLDCRTKEDRRGLESDCGALNSSGNLVVTGQLVVKKELPNLFVYLSKLLLSWLRLALASSIKDLGISWDITTSFLEVVELAAKITNTKGRNLPFLTPVVNRPPVDDINDTLELVLNTNGHLNGSSRYAKL